MTALIGAQRETIPYVVKNVEGVYEGDLAHYYWVIFNFAKNLNNSYHNFRHLFHMVWLCYTACQYYIPRGLMTKREARNLVIGASFHDFDHSGKGGHDDLNIIAAIRGLEKHILEEDMPYFAEICSIIRPTEYPYVVEAKGLSLLAQIMRDADVSQVFSTAWIQQVIFGLGNELGLTPMQMLKMQEPFISKLEFTTDWAKERFGDLVVKEKLEEVRDLVSLSEKPVSKQA